MNANRSIENNNLAVSVNDMDKQRAQQGVLLAMEVADWSSDPLDVAQRMSEFYNTEALHAFDTVLEEKRYHASLRQRRGLGETCEDCGGSIPLERITATRGRATRCKPCQEQYEDRRRNWR